MKTTNAFYAGLLLAALATSASAQNIVNNGSFEALSGSGASNTGQGITGWSIITTGGVDIVTSSTAVNHWLAADGNISLSLNYFGPTTIYQAITTTPGLHYQLSFYMAAEIYGGPATRTMNVSWDGAIIGSPSFSYTGQGPSNMGWTLMTFNVVGTGNDTLAFTSTTPNNYGPALDAVSLTAVPEPVPIGLAGLGVIVLGALRRFCKPSAVQT